MKENKFLKSLLASLLAFTAVASSATPVFAEDTAAEPEEAVLEEAPAEAEELPAEEVAEELPVEGVEEELPAEEVTVEEEAVEETVSFYQEIEDVTVSAEAAANVFPDGTVMTVKKVDDEATLELAAQAVGENATTKVAVDITFICGNDEIQPNGEVRVTISSPEIAELDNPVLVHVDDKQEEVTPEVVEQIKEPTPAEEVTADLESFSVYAVVEDGGTGDDARLKVNFVQTDGTTTILVKKTDDKKETIDGVEVDHFEEVLYDPGAGALTGRQMFKGWTTEENYTDETTAKTIADVRNEVKAQLYDGVTEGESVTYYAMIFDVYSLMLLDEDGAVLRSESVIVKSGSSKSYTVNQFYDPKDPDSRFEGWAEATQDADGKWVISDNPDPLYPNGTEFTFGAGGLNKDLVLKAYVPAGKWLIFKENGEGASYTAPQFYRGQVTQEPTPAPTRFGYEFGGWYLDEGCTEKFVFGNVLEKTTRVYAKWNANTKANYTVVIWTENLAGDGYDYKEVVTVRDANVGANTNVTGNADDVQVSINGTRKSYTGFHLKAAPENKTVTPEGTAVVNVYFDRTEYTFTFQTQNGTTIHTVTRKYDTDITDIWNFTGSNGVTYPRSDTSWTPHGSDTYTARITVMQRMPAENIRWTHTSSDNTKRYFHYMREVPDGETGTKTYAGRQFDEWKVFENDFNIVFYNDDFWVLKGFERLAITKSNDEAVSLTAGNSIRWTALNSNYGGTDNHLYFYYTRMQYPINYMDGKYVDGYGVELDEANRGQLHESAKIDYDADISSYGKGGANYYAAADKTPQGYTFGGWYIDQPCTVPYDFTRMPIDGLTVYAKWIKNQYRVFLHPNVPTDEAYEYGDQETSFRIDYDEEISKIQYYRDEYTLSGWYRDPDFTQSFNFDAFAANDNTVYEAYDQTESTERNEYGVETSSENKDAKNNRFWIKTKLDLYAKWRYKLVGADGINVVYDAVEGKGTFAGGEVEHTDPLVYQDASTASAQTASVATSANEEFKYWVLYSWNGTEFVPTEQTVLPGQTFVVYAKDAHKTENSDHTEDDPSYTYTIKLVAEYGSIEAPADTHINWYSNVKDILGNTMDLDKFHKTTDKSEADKGWYVTNDPIEINKGYNIMPADTYSYDDYAFLGWAKLEEHEKASDKVFTEADLFLKWVPASGDKAAHFETQDGRTVTQVAADENHPYEDLYAVWYKPETIRINHSSNRAETNDNVLVYVSDTLSDTTAAIAQNFATTKGYEFIGKTDKIDMTEYVSDGYFYGGYYKHNNNTGNYTGDPNYWVEDDAWTNNGLEVDPDVLMNDQNLTDKTYYLKEVPVDYLVPKTQYVYNKYRGNVVTKLLALTAIDDGNYNAIEAVDIDGNVVDVHIANKYTVKGEASKDFTAQSLISKDGYVVVWNAKETKPQSGVAFGDYSGTSAIKANQTMTQVLRLITLDNVVVERATRVVTTGNNSIGFATPGDLKSTTTNKTTITYSAYDNSGE